jgi:type II secretion system protein J
VGGELHRFAGMDKRTGPIDGGALMRRRGPGFTLIEVVLAVAMSAVLLTIVYWTYFSINRSVDAATENQEALETGRMLSELLKKDIRGIVSNRFSLKATNVTVEGYSLGQMEFVTTAGFYADLLKLRRIGYELFMDDKGGKILVRKESTDLNDPLDNTATVFELSRIVKGFQLEFFNGTDWTTTWDSDAAGTFPQEIRVTFDVSDTKGNVKRFAADESIQSMQSAQSTQSTVQ